MNTPLTLSMILTLSLLMTLTLTWACQCPSCNQADTVQRCQCCVYRQLGKRSESSSGADDGSSNLNTKTPFNPAEVSSKSSFLQKRLSAAFTGRNALSSSPEGPAAHLQASQSLLQEYDRPDISSMINLLTKREEFHGEDVADLAYPNTDDLFGEESVMIKGSQPPRNLALDPRFSTQWIDFLRRNHPISVHGKRDQIFMRRPRFFGAFSQNWPGRIFPGFWPQPIQNVTKVYLAKRDDEFTNDEILQDGRGHHSRPEIGAASKRFAFVVDPSENGPLSEGQMDNGLYVLGRDRVLPSQSLLQYFT